MTSYKCRLHRFPDVAFCSQKGKLIYFVSMFVPYLVLQVVYHLPQQTQSESLLPFYPEHLGFLQLP